MPVLIFESETVLCEKEKCLFAGKTAIVDDRRQLSETAPPPLASGAQRYIPGDIRRIGIGIGSGIGSRSRLPLVGSPGPGSGSEARGWNLCGPTAPCTPFSR